MGELFFPFQILLSHNNNHLTASCGLAAASKVEGERERGGGGGGGCSCGWTVTNPVHNIAAQWWISHPSSPLCLIGPLQSAHTQCHRAHIHAFHLSISGPDLGQVSFLRLSLSGHRGTIWKSVDLGLAVHNFCSCFDSECRRNVRKNIKSSP